METFLHMALGVAIVLTVAYDAHVTILHSRGRNGPISRLLFGAFWRLATSIVFRLKPLERHRQLNSVGPLLMPMLLSIYLVLLVLGFALIYYPNMPAHFSIAPGAVSTRWIDSLYFSGITL